MGGSSKRFGPDSASWPEPILLKDHRRPSAGGLVIAVEHVGVEIDSVRPADRSCDIVDLDLAENARIPNWLEDTALERCIEVQFSDEAVGEGQTEAEVPEVFDFDNPGQPAHGDPAY